MATEILLPLLKDISSSGLARLSAPEVVALALLTRQTRYATASDVLRILTNWPCFQCVISDYTMEWLLSISDEEVKLNELHGIEPIQLLRNVVRLLRQDVLKFATDFPPHEYLVPRNCQGETTVKELVLVEAAEEEQDLEAAPREVKKIQRGYLEASDYEDVTTMPRYAYDYSRDDWLPSFHTEYYRRQEEGRLKSKRTMCLPFDKEYESFAKYFSRSGPNLESGVIGVNHFTQLPLELKKKIMDMSFRYTEVLKIITNEKRTRWKPRSHVEELTDIEYDFRALAKIPKGLIPSDDYLEPDLGHRYWLLEHPSELLQARSVSREFDALVKESFFGMNTFELHDSTAVLLNPDETPKFDFRDPQRFMAKVLPGIVAHRWLEYMMDCECLDFIKKLNIDIALDGTGEGQTMWHVRRTFQVLIWMPRLRRLVVTLDMGSFVNTMESYDPDFQFPYENAAEHWELWPGIRMLAWALAAKGCDNRKSLQVHIPQNRDVEAWIGRLMALHDTSRHKFWVRDDWIMPSEGFANVDIWRAVAAVVARTHLWQELRLH